MFRFRRSKRVRSVDAAKQQRGTLNVGFRLDFRQFSGKQMRYKRRFFHTSERRHGREKQRLLDKSFKARSARFV